MSYQAIDSDTVNVYINAMSTNTQSLLTIDQLATRSGVPIRTVRFYIAEGLLPGASTRGKGPSYTQEHLDRLQLIRLLVARHLPLAEIRTLVTQLPPGEVHAVLEEERARAEEVSAHADKPTSPKEYLSALLDQARGYSGNRATGGSSRLGGGGSGSTGVWQQQVGKARLSDSPVPPAPGVPTPPRQSLREQAHGLDQAVLWHHWELALGIELLVRADVAQTDREVIESVLNAVRAVLGQG